jgi:hypothetical protein
MEKKKSRSPRRKRKTAYDWLKPWIGSVRTGGRHDSRNAGDQMADDLEAKYRSQRAR